MRDDTVWMNVLFSVLLETVISERASVSVISYSHYLKYLCLETAAHNSEPFFYVLCLISQRNHLHSASFHNSFSVTRAERVHLPVCARRGIVVILITVNSTALQSLKLGLKSRSQ